MVLLDNGGRARHEVVMLPPPDDLRGLVEHITLQPHPDQSSDWRVVPDASPHFIASVVESAAGRRLRVALVGPRSHAAVVDLRGRTMTVAVRFRPGALAALVRDSAAEFADRSPAIGDIFARHVLDGLELGPDAPPALLAAEMLRLVRRAARRTQVGSTADALAGRSAGRPGTGLVEIRDGLAVPERTLRDRAQREIGLSPKPILRILRLHQALMLARRPARSWADIAQMAGYADQAHFTRECRSLLGETPGAWSRRSHRVRDGEGGCRFLQDTIPPSAVG